MTFTVLTLFPELVESYFRSSVMAKAVERGLVGYQTVNIRDFATDKHRTCDDAPYGGGAGMVLKAQPLARALDSVNARDKWVVYPSPAGRRFNQAAAERLAGVREIVLICGRYEGIDQRIIDLYVHEELSIGDYVISSGEVASMVIIDSVYRLLSGVIAEGSLREESHVGGLLEYPQYTRPEVFRGRRVPDVLLSGHHEKIEAWRQDQSRERTRDRRPDLLRENGGSNGSDKGN